MNNMNMKKRKILIIAVLAICFASMSAGSFAYFTYQDKAHNVITSGNVKIEVQEWADEDQTVSFPEEGVDGVLPGDKIVKIVEVKNVGSGDCWIRVKVEKNFQLAEGETGAPDTDVLKLDIDSENWTEQDGWYYYNSVLQAGETCQPLFRTVEFDPGMGNMYQKGVAAINISAQAVQAANNGSSALEAAGWPED